MLRRLFVAVVAAACCLAFTADAQAVFITSNGDIQMVDPLGPGSPVGPPLLDIKRIDGAGGIIFANTIGGVVVGNDIRFVTVEPVASALNGTNVPATLPSAGNPSMVAITGLRGTIFAFNGAGGAFIRFTAGRLFLTEEVAGFNVKDPTTWNFGSRFAEFALKPQENVISGAPLGAAISFPAVLTNTSTPNDGSVIESQARALFVEDSTDAQNAGATPGLGAGTGGDNWLSNVDDASPPGLVKTDEALLSDSDQTIEDLTLAQIVADTPGGFGAPEIAALDAIDMAAFGLPFDTGVGTGIFAPAGLAAFNGDFRGTFNSENYIGHQAIPEPGSMTLLALGAIGLGLCRVRRQRLRNKTEGIA